MRQYRPLAGIAVLAVLLVSFVAADDARGPGGRPSRLDRIETTIVEAGIIESADVTRILNEASGPRTILRLVPDGSTVSEGDLLIQLDDADLRDQLIERQVASEQAETNLEAATAQLNAAKDALEADLPVAELKLQVAELARKRKLGEGGELDQRLRQIELQITIAERQLKVFERTGATTATGPESRLQLESARSEERLLQEFIRPHESAVLDLAIREAQANMNRTRRSGEAAIREAQAAVKTASLQLQAATQKLELVRQQITACRITAPRDGLVMYANPPARRSAAPVLEEGATVRERQLLLEMPDVDRLQARVRVHESQISRVKPGQSVSLKLAALPRQAVAGRVASIARTPEPQSTWLNPGVVEYAVIVEIPEPPAGLRIGMTVAAEVDTGPRQSQ